MVSLAAVRESNTQINRLYGPNLVAVFGKFFPRGPQLARGGASTTASSFSPFPTRVIPS